MTGSSTVVELLIRARDLASNTIDRVRGAVVTAVIRLIEV